MLLWAAVCGVFGAFTTVFFRDSIRFLELFLEGRAGSLVAIAESLPVAVRLLLPALGGAVAGTLLLIGQRLSPRASSDYMEAIAIGDGNISVQSSLLRSASSLFTIATGGSIGREGSMVQLAAMAASVVASGRHLDPARMRLLVACGAAAGLSAAYSAPIAGALFISEIVLGSISMASFVPILVAAIVSNITMRALPGYSPVYQMPAFPQTFGVEIVYFLTLGVICGALAPPFLSVLRIAKSLFNRLDVSPIFRLALGGLGVGLVSVWQPGVWGNGYSVVNALLHSAWAWQSVLLLLACKILATALTTGSGAVGGVFTPTLFVGAALGYLAGVLVHGLFPATSSPAFAYVMVGMGAFLAAATSAPFMAMLMIAEMTTNYDAMVPLMLACVVAYFVSRALNGSSMYEITVSRIRQFKSTSQLRDIRMRELIQPAGTVLNPSATFAELSKMFLENPVKFIYIVDASGRYEGTVALHDIASILLENRPAEQAHIHDLVHLDGLPLLHPEMKLTEAFDYFVKHPGERLPVVEPALGGRLLGVVYKSQLLAAFAGSLEGAV